METTPSPESTPQPRRTLIITCLVLVLISVCCIAVAGLVAWLDPMDWNLLARLTGKYDGAAEAIPADADVYIGLDLLQLQSADAQRVFRAFAESNPDSSFASSADLVKDLDEEMSREVGFTFTEDILPWVGQYAGIGLTDWKINEFGGVDSLNFVFAATIRDRTEAAAFAKVLQAQIEKKNGAVLTTTEYEGAAIFSLPGQPGDGVAFTIHRGLFLLSMDVATIQRSIDAKRGTSFMDTVDFRNLSADLPGGDLLTVFVRSELLEQLTSVMGSGLVSGTGLGSSLQWQTGALSFSFVPEGIRMDLAAIYDPESTSNAQQLLLDAHASGIGIDGRVPENTLLLLAGRRLDLNWAIMREQMESNGRGTDFDEAMASFESEFGFNPSTDLVANLDGEYAIAVLPGTDGMLASENIDLGFEILFETSNPAALAPVLTAFGNLLSDQLGVDPDPIEVNGYTIQQVADPFLGEILAYSLFDDLLLVTSSAHLANDVITGGPSLRENGNYQATWDVFPSGMNPVFYFDVAGLIGTVREGMDATDRQDFDANIGVFAGPIEKIAMGNHFAGADKQLATIIVFISGGSE